MKTIQMTIDAPLLDALDRARRDSCVSRSAFIRQAVASALQQQETQRQEQRHAAGYRARPVAPGEFDPWFDEQVWDRE